jgi:LacI family transcriptional regulator
MSQIQRIAVLLQSASSFANGVLLGIGRYARPQHPWVFLWCPPAADRIAQFRKFQPAGIIAYLANSKLIAPLATFGVPVVNVSAALSETPFPRVTADNEPVGRLVAERFLTDGFRHFGFVGRYGVAFTAVREQGFRQAIEPHNGSYATFDIPTQPSGGRDSSPTADRRLMNWLQARPKPVGIMVATDADALTVLQCCLQANLHVPDDVAVIGVDDDSVACQLAYPTLSSVRLPLDQIGYEAARLLDRLMAGKRPPKRPILLPPIGVVVRESSNVVAIRDRKLAQAVAYIRQRGNEPLGVEDVARAVGMSRRVLEKRFQTQLGRTPFAEIRRAQIEWVKAMLLNSPLSQDEIAAASPFASTAHLATAFKQATGQTPGQFRKQHRRH